MGIQFETDYNMETLTAMAKGLRKTVRRKRSRRVQIFAAVVLVLGILTILATVAGGEPLGASGVVTLLAMLVVILVSLFEDKLNAWFARKRLLPGTEHAVATFEEDGYEHVGEQIFLCTDRGRRRDGALLCLCPVLAPHAGV